MDVAEKRAPSHALVDRPPQEYRRQGERQRPQVVASHGWFPQTGQRTIALAHGAGAGMDTPFMAFFATTLANRSFRVVRFEFPYMASGRKTAKKKPPDREPVLRETWLRVVEMLERDHLVIGGKSMGGRIASLVADEAGVAGLVCLGYPFHPVGKPDRLRVDRKTLFL